MWEYILRMCVYVCTIAVAALCPGPTVTILRQLSEPGQRADDLKTYYCKTIR